MRHLVNVWVELFKSLYEAYRPRAKPERQLEPCAVSSVMGHQGSIPQEIPMVAIINSFDQSFACCEMILHGHC